MYEAAIPLLASWENFYVIIGSASASLTGLMFVVVTLIARNPSQGSVDSIGAFGTPTIVHFCAALLIAALLNAPWPLLWYASLPLGLCGFSGIGYSIIIVRRARQQNDYQPVMEDWLWHIIFPLVSYTALVVTAFLIPIKPGLALFIVAGGTLLFLFIGIHNAWDTVTYLVIKDAHSEQTQQK